MDVSTSISSVITGIQGKRDILINKNNESLDGASNAFSTIFDQMLNLVSETDALSAEAEAAEINFSLGNADSTHEVTVAQQKALVSLQYTVAVKNALMEAYREIMNIQI